MRNLNLTRILLGLLSLSWLVMSCDDLIEPDISAARVQLLAPGDSAALTSSLQTFRWEPIPGARQYRIQLAAPSFKNPVGFFLDSVTSRAFFAASLLPGTYYWRVQAVNGSYTTAYTQRRFQLDSTSSLTSQSIALARPASGSVTNQTTVTFTWTPLPMAQRYLLTLAPHPRTGTGSLDTLLPAVASLPLRLPARSQTYQWQVTALNATSLRASATQRFDVDVTPPATPTLGTPLEGEFFSSLPLTLTWNRVGADVLADSLFVYAADQTTLVTSFPRIAATASFTVPLGSPLLVPGTYFWAVRSLDKAGNRSPLTAKRSFLLQ